MRVDMSHYGDPLLAVLPRKKKKEMRPILGEVQMMMEKCRKTWICHGGSVCICVCVCMDVSIHVHDQLQQPSIPNYHKS